MENCVRAAALIASAAREHFLSNALFRVLLFSCFIFQNLPD
jgi:hypothetical protein